MRYKIEFQYKPEGSPRPYDESYKTVTMESGGTALIPNVGDFILVTDSKGTALEGVVATRLFNYVNLGQDDWCIVNIVVTDTDVDFGTLLKE